MNKSFCSRKVMKMCGIFCVLLLLCGCQKQSLPVPQHPIDLETISEALDEIEVSCKIEEMGTEDGIPEEQDEFKIAGYALRKNDSNDLYASVTSFIEDGERGFTMVLLSFDEDPELSDEECKKAIVFATILLGGFEDESQIYDEYNQNNRLERKEEWEGTVNNMDCAIRFGDTGEASNQRTLLLSFYTDKEAFLDQ